MAVFVCGKSSRTGEKSCACPRKRPISEQSSGDEDFNATMGTGFGAGIICENVLMRGACDMGGEIGHIRLEEDGPVGFGKAGSIEGFCSGGGIGRLAISITQKLIDEGNTPAWIQDGIKLDEINAKLIADYANNVDKDAKQIYYIVGEKLGKANTRIPLTYISYTLCNA